jgi:hypothetical protein
VRKKQSTNGPADKPKATNAPETKLPALGVFNVEVRDSPPQGPPAKEIHQRRKLPPITEASPSGKARKAERPKKP